MPHHSKFNTAGPRAGGGPGQDPAATLAELGRQRARWEGALAAAERRTLQLEAELAAKCKQVELLEARAAEQAAARKQQQLQTLMLETKLRVLLECYQHLEASSNQLGGAAYQAVPLLHRPAGRELQWQSPTKGSGAQGDGTLALHCPGAQEDMQAEPLVPGSHLALANRCADLEFSLLQQQQSQSALESEAAQLRQEVQRLQGQLAQQAQQLQQAQAQPPWVAGAALSGAAAQPTSLQSIHVGAREQVAAAQEVALLRQQLAARDAALRASEARNAQLQGDLKRMLGARDAIAALQKTLQQAAA